jgi:hypothetical protein
VKRPDGSTIEIHLDGQFQQVGSTADDDAGSESDDDHGEDAESGS